MTKAVKRLILVYGLVCFAWSGLFAHDQSEPLQYLTEDIHPYNYLENGELKGIAVDLLKLIWQDLGIEPQEIKILPWARAYRMLQNGERTVLFSTAKTEERADQFKWACPITTSSGTAFIALKSKHLVVNSAQDLKKYKIGTIRNDAAEQLLLYQGFDAERIEPVSNLFQNLKKLEVGRIDLIAYNDDSFYRTLVKNGIRVDPFETVFVEKRVEPCYAFSKDVPDGLIQKFQEALDKQRESARYHDILDHYLHR